MANKHKIRQAIGIAADELEAMATLSAKDFSQSAFDAKKQHIRDLQEQLALAEDNELAMSGIATRLPGQDRFPARFAPATPGRAGVPKYFHDREIEGRMVRAADQAYVAGMWCKATVFGREDAADWCREHGVEITKAQGEGTDSAGGYLVPEELMAAIIVLREEFGVFRKECQVVPMGTDSLNWPRRTGGLQAYFTVEGQAIAESSASWDQVNLSAKKLAVLTRMSNEISQDAVIQVADWLVEEISYAFASKEDDCGFNGDGSSTYGGIRGISNLVLDGTHNAMKFTASSATPTSLTTKDITGVIGTLPAYAAGGAKFFMSQQMFYQVVGTNLAGAGGNRLDVLTEGIEKMLLGFPVVIAQKLPVTSPGSGKPMFYFGNLSKAALMGDRRAVTIRRSDQRYFEQDQVGLLGTERFDLSVHDLGDNQVVGPLVALISP